MQIVSSGPDNSNFGIRRAYEEIIAQAQNYVSHSNTIFNSR